MGILQRIKDFFRSLVTRDPQEAQKRRELKRIYGELLLVKPAIYRKQDNTVLPGFAAVLYEFCRLVRPLEDLLRRTVSHTDIRIAQRYRDSLIDAQLPEEARKLKERFSYDVINYRIAASPQPDDEMEAISREFQAFLKVIDLPETKALNNDLSDLERLIDICKSDYERILGLFDPSASLDNPAYRPQFMPAVSAQLYPELTDLFFLIADFSVSVKTEAHLAVLLGRLSPSGALEPQQKKQLDKVLVNLNRILKHQLNTATLLNLLRAVKQDPTFMPPINRERVEAVEAYRARIATQFQKDRERILRERHENAVTADITALFGDGDILKVEGYDEATNELLQRDSPNSFNYVKPLRILKTFLVTRFEGQVRDSTKRILIEGYFDNKSFQNTFANIFYQCDKSGERMEGFEQLMNTPGRTSVMTLRRYVEEIRKGKDMTLLLNKLVDSMNDRARELVDLEANLYYELANCLYEIVGDYKKSTPEIISNIRTLGAGKNRELITCIADGYNDMVKFVKIMKNFTVIRTQSTTVAPAMKENEPAANVEEL